MVDLDEETIDVVKRIKDSLKETRFEIDHIEVGKTGEGGTMVVVDVRRSPIEEQGIIK